MGVTADLCWGTHRRGALTLLISGFPETQRVTGSPLGLPRLPDIPSRAPAPCDVHGPLVPSTGKVPGDDCPLVWGQCSHCFHMHCILKWLNAQQVQQHCPMCRQEWKFKE